ncbi:MAG: DUF255 domain-containing protein [Bacteroidetes bacterium]|nr:MAG: DUF255 domain-containing protein [Bacteroidota bacterium]
MKYIYNVVLIVLFSLMQIGCGPMEEKTSVVALTQAQMQNPVKWEFSVNKISETEAELVFKADIEKGWHLYSQEPGSDVVIPTSFQITASKIFSLEGSVKEITKPIKKEEPILDNAVIAYFENNAEFRQKIKINSKDGFSISGTLNYMSCDDRMCLPPTDVDFEFRIEGTGPAIPDSADSTHARVQDTTVKTSSASGNPYKFFSIDLNNPAGPCGEKREDLTLWGIFLLGILGGAIALLTPCVFPMIPLTVSFFTKSGTSKKGMRDSMLYGFFIMFIYFLLSMPFHLIPGIDPEVLNRISTNTWLNILFFLIFVVFAISFFGYFEITLPSRWATQTDSASNFGGFAGIFFMALTLAIVSFSCTGPILGTLLAGTLNADSAGTINFLGMDLQIVAVKLTIGMLGFGLALGFPFALFAAFPAWLNSLPKSGGWLNSVKVVLGFVEVALAIKFFSNADLVEQWGFLKRETFFALWFLCGVGLTLYIFGILKFPHDSPVKKFSVSRLVFGFAALAFTVYLFPAIIGAKWWNYHLLSGFPPPNYYSYFNKTHDKKIFTDFSEGMAYAREQNKPVMLDFTGWACVNCRKMEEDVWPVEAVKNILDNDYVVISLYVDERTKLSEEKQHTVDVPDGEGGKKKKKIRTIGDQWSTLEALTFGNNTQPLYVLLSPDTVLLGNPVGYTPNIDSYVKYLNCGLETFERGKK